MCKIKNCKIQPIFNFEGEKKRLFCYSHKFEGMIDIKNETCEFKDCKIQ